LSSGTPAGKVVYKNYFATNHTITDETVVAIVLAGRTRWKVENENNNTLKTKGYNLEHNFGHGKHYLASFLATLNILSLLFHTLLELMDDKYSDPKSI
jgi:TfoX/Sxy family transcriptional regulator of competence genes